MARVSWWNLNHAQSIRKEAHLHCPEFRSEGSVILGDAADHATVRISQVRALPPGPYRCKGTPQRLAAVQGSGERSADIATVRWPRLPGTAEEAKAVSRGLDRYAKQDPLVYMGRQALSACDQPSHYLDSRGSHPPMRSHEHLLRRTGEMRHKLAASHAYVCSAVEGCRVANRWC